MQRLLVLLAMLALVACDVPNDPAVPKALARVKATLLAGSPVAVCWEDTSGKTSCKSTLDSSLDITPVPQLDGAKSLISGSSLVGLLPDGSLVDTFSSVVVARHVVQAGYAYEGGMTCWVAEDGTAACSYLGVETPIPLSGATARQVAVSQNELCVLLDDGTVRCWLMHDGWSIKGAGEPIDGIERATQIAVSSNDSSLWACAIVTGGEVRCWGENTNGELGRGTAGPEVTTAAPVLDGDNGNRPLVSAVAIALGNDHSAAILDDGSVHMWGHSVFSSGVARRVPEIDHATALGLGTWLDCALVDGQITCWGGTHHVGPEGQYAPAAY
jgi:hypothetical protein